MRRPLLVVTLGLIMLLAVVGCSSGGSGSGGSGGQAISTNASEMKFEPNTWTVKAGQPVTVTVKNVGTVTHDWIVRGQDDATKVEVQAGQTGTKTFTIASAGTYAVYCSQPGHEAAGMKGTLTVQ
jgi:uncharacterized cupredoxin-like copper-binding protein